MTSPDPLNQLTGLYECAIAGVAVGLLDPALGLLAFVHRLAERRGDRAAGFPVVVRSARRPRTPRPVLAAGPAVAARRGPWQSWRTPPRLRHLRLDGRSRPTTAAGPGGAGR